MLIHHYLVVLVVWSLYATYCYTQYSQALKSSPWFIVIALVYALTTNLLWVYLSRSLDQKTTLSYALLWDSGVHCTAFLIPVLILGDKIKWHTALGMSFIFLGVGIVLFYEKVESLVKF